MRVALRRSTSAAGGLAGACIAGCLTLGCGEPARPPPARDLPLPAPPQDDASLIDPEPLKPDLMSPCGAATVALDFLRPNLYFAVDASASMRDSIPPGEASPADPAVVVPPQDRYRALAVAIQSLLERVGHRVNYGAVLFPTADTACDSGEEVLGLSRGDAVSFAVSGEVGPVLGALMFAINRRTPRGGTPVAAALGALLPKLRGKGAETYVFLVTDGGPNCDRQARCGPESCIPNLEHVLLSEGVSCEEPINCCDPSLFGPQNCLDDNGSMLAVNALAQAGVRTFVIGIPGSETYADVLDQLALAGGVPRAGSPSYYRVGDAAQLTETVSRLGLGVALSCTLKLEEPAPDPSLVNVFFDGQIVPADPVDGWSFIDDRTVQLLGNSCLLLQTGDVLQADIVAGCPVVIR